jgi:hypothetical protein
MRAGTGFHPDQAARDITEPASKLMTRYLLPQNNHAALVEPNQMESVLADVDADRADSFQAVLRCAHRILLALCASRLQCSRLAAERGRAIPLAVIAATQQLSPFLLFNHLVGGGEQR